MSFVLVSDYPFGIFNLFFMMIMGHHGHARMDVGFTTIYAISANQH
jgi:hypothetical protein